MISNSQNTNFGTKIVVSREAYDRKPLWFLRKFGKSVEFPWTMKESKFLKRQGFTSGAVTCTSGILKVKDGDEFYIFHINPDRKENSWSVVKNELVKAQERLKQGNKDVVLEGFLIGANPQFLKSIEYAQDMMRFFKETGVHFSALLGQKTPYADLHYSQPKDTVTIAFPYCREVKDFSGLEKTFSHVVIDDGDTIQFGQKTLREKFFLASRRLFQCVRGGSE